MKAMKINDFDYYLPEKLIAQSSTEPRDCSRLMVLRRNLGQIEHQHFYNIVDYLRSGDVPVLNQTKVFKARLKAKIDNSQRQIEVFLLRSVDGQWEALLGGARHTDIGSKLIFNDQLRAEVISKDFEVGSAYLKFYQSDDQVLDYCQQYGSIPVPPYVKNQPEKLEQYQTVYAKETGSVAAPTAGFHFTIELLEKIKNMGVRIEYITLHVGVGTFRPVKTEIVEDHVMHAEWVEISDRVAKEICRAKQECRRVIAVGTTTTRALEGVAMQTRVSPPYEGGGRGGCEGYSGDINIFIKPGFEFKIIDGLITNFHLPKSTLLILVSALAGNDLIKKAYNQAIELEYKFYSFGDAMFII
ncbi:MAG: S-adenosylmethionine:tRNA ribosyltransferase-isomerase [Candidatus Uhrbacteria bacterium GW2011_GWD1_41_16]|uniref:S-adenosylmethionine:tRNA ribosyltransferase-isomerase n=1 Tax=Candidatus Uhrbacteria bacterium GW2011_GWC1_41_20 TaxID=1618983 RepID=A0A0G0VD34_9BACT|nr:MAG: S-adenosylmethionine:tRNA ribosyltransferase-isomerase [Candidatus Uhrbacteria bacterium GW2011_GWE1_39_46]KKR63114.1 MAG: S-adenosylmethionine:tRNA ribosyltransferase-isomerase [Candidatus Uhrbacteria bacterium GW2011_GWC2_40_450]KKR94249.1 MAG: S-adenosylmethionine:tRNA ribosyltransferase-isomerase [Candidatus Uhrbacteria bacterium GW2011_GWD1_41_16]KKR97556.1 MAG: S-adenosylmethionine/tRNA-ribosyltransferase-isomerase, S-adenosylmethionine:tRNA ribosyltransferase-isomerase [Candidatus